MVTVAYVTFDHIMYDSGAGKVCLNEIQALEEVGELVGVVGKSYSNTVDKPPKFPFTMFDVDRVYGYNPWVYDYFVSEHVPVDVDLLHCSCSPATKIVEKAKPKKFVCNIVAHDLKTSIEEHERIYQQPYPFAHNTVPYLHERLIRHANIADCVFTPSNHSAEWIRSNLNPKRIQVIPHGVDLPKETSPFPEQFTVGYMGQGGPDKGLLYLLLAWEKLGWKDTDLWFAGGCCNELPPWINEFCPNTKNNIRMMGWVENTKQFFDRVSCIVVPSVTEGFGLLTLEAMAHGKPAIVSTGAGSEMVVSDCIDGVKCLPREPEQLARLIGYLRNSDYATMGVQARKKAELYTWDIIREWYKGVYRGLME